MLNDIRLHVDADDALQSQYEQKFAREIKHRELNNIAAFKRYMPNVAAIIDQLPVGGWSIFVNKFEQSNLVHVNSGNTFYSVQVDDNIATQCKYWGIHSALLDISADAAVPQLPNYSNYSALNEYAQAVHTQCKTRLPDALVILGLGKGLHLQYLLEQIDTKHIAVYEPDWELFKLSLMLFDWAKFLQHATEQGKQLFLQLGPQQASIYDDMHELQTQLGVERVVFFQHLKLPIYTHIINCVRQHKWGPQIFENVPECTDYRQHHLNHVCAISPFAWKSKPQSKSLFNSNLALFKEHFANIYEAFKDYTPRDWQVLHKPNGEVNLFNRTQQSFYAHDTPKHDGKLQALGFSEHPNLDGLAFGYVGDKLKHYVHNSFVRQADMCLKTVDNEKGCLPLNVKALLVFGLGSGYTLESLYNMHNINNLIICEPNPDFFYASLFAFDWQPVFAKIKDADARLYINIGEASSRLYKDLMSQFLAIGPHLLNETYILQGYKNPLLNKVLNEVRIQLQVIFSMGENFDHVLYGIGHTHFSLQHKHLMLRHSPSQYLTHHQKQLPIFIVGNGPSLDENISLLKEYAEQVVIISCGTALQALHRNNIVPDFHAEVEQNRANFDWVSRVDDDAYLKKITLLGVSGMHPDSIALFKNVLLSFKSGESSTVATLAMLPDKSFHTLDYAYPTVSNLVVDICITLGFEQLYLVGVDLGFADKEKHHSKSSGYYVNDQQLYNYQAAHNVELTAKGNKQDWVFTKTEFNISRMLIEQALQVSKAECFNLSNGVFIEGTLPLDAENVLVVSTPEDKTAVLKGIEGCYMCLSSDISQMFNSAYSNDLFMSQVTQLKQSCSVNLDDKNQIDLLIKGLRKQLLQARSDGGSLYFYYFFNSVNYLCAALGKANMHAEQEKALELASIILNKWRIFLSDASHLLASSYNIVDVASAFAEIREANLLVNRQAKPVNFYLPISGVSSSIVSSIALEIGNFKLQRTIDGLPQMGNAVAVILSEDDFNNIVDHTLQTSLSLLCVFHDYALLSKCHKCYRDNQVCFMYLAPPVVSKNERSESQLLGWEPYTDISDYLHVIQARLLDISSFSIILCKPKFEQSGLINAYNFEELSAESQRSDMIPSKLSEEEQQDNEYTSRAAHTLEKLVISQLNFSSHIMFKHYLAVPRSENNSINFLDSLSNRGLSINRAPFNFELLGAWHNVAD